MAVHIEAKKGEIAESVLVPGDPLRAKWIAETYLDDSFCYNRVRGMLGYTGYYKGKRVSVQGGGMGIPSSLIYYHELIKEYDVKNIIRVGSAGSYQKEVHLKDIVIAMAASTTSGINNNRFVNSDYAPTASFKLFSKAVDCAREKGIPFKAGNVLSSDEFYEDDPNAYKLWAQYGVLCVEMETAGLYTLAAKWSIEALTLLTISDSLVTGERLSHKEKETSFNEMVQIALDLI